MLKDVVDGLKLVADGIESVKTIADAIKSGRDYLKAKHPEVQTDLRAMLADEKSLSSLNRRRRS